MGRGRLRRAVRRGGARAVAARQCHAKGHRAVAKTAEINARYLVRRGRDRTAPGNVRASTVTAEGIGIGRSNLRSGKGKAHRCLVRHRDRILVDHNTVAAWGRGRLRRAVRRGGARAVAVRQCHAKGHRAVAKTAEINARYLVRRGRDRTAPGNVRASTVTAEGIGIGRSNLRSGKGKAHRCLVRHRDRVLVDHNTVAAWGRGRLRRAVRRGGARAVAVRQCHAKGHRAVAKTAEINARYLVRRGRDRTAPGNVRASTVTAEGIGIGRSNLRSGKGKAHRCLVRHRDRVLVDHNTVAAWGRGRLRRAVRRGGARAVAVRQCHAKGHRAVAKTAEINARYLVRRGRDRTAPGNVRASTVTAEGIGIGRSNLRSGKGKAHRCLVRHRDRVLVDHNTVAAWGRGRLRRAVRRGGARAVAVRQCHAKGHRAVAKTAEINARYLVRRGRDRTAPGNVRASTVTAEGIGIGRSNLRSGKGKAHRCLVRHRDRVLVDHNTVAAWGRGRLRRAVRRGGARAVAVRQCHAKGHRAVAKTAEINARYLVRRGRDRTAPGNVRASTVTAEGIGIGRSNLRSGKGKAHRCLVRHRDRVLVDHNTVAAWGRGRLRRAVRRGGARAVAVRQCHAKGHRAVAKTAEINARYLVRRGRDRTAPGNVRASTVTAEGIGIGRSNLRSGKGKAHRCLVRHRDRILVDHNTVAAWDLAKNSYCKKSKEYK